MGAPNLPSLSTGMSTRYDGLKKYSELNVCSSELLRYLMVGILQTVSPKFVTASNTDFSMRYM